jgi:ABC-type lipoprotein export system ATPase subunit
MISVSNLAFSYSTQAIQFPDFALKKGEHLLLLGESGSGKTTLLHLMGGLLRSYSGSVRIENTELSSLSETALDQFRGQHIGFVFQKNHLITALSVEKNLMLSPYLSGLKIDHERISQVLSRLGLSEKRKSRITELSHGQAQRVAIARAVLNKPSIIFADEPTSALDDTNCDRVIDLLLEVANENDSTLVVATHDHRLRKRISKEVKLNATSSAIR